MEIRDLRRDMLRRTRKQQNKADDAQHDEADDADGARTGQGRPLVSTRLFRFGRVLFGGVLAFMAIDNLRNLDGRIQYAESKGVPSPEVSVPGISTALLLGSIGITLWRLPSLAAGAVASFFVSVTPVMHDFWAEDDPEQEQQQLVQFLKNTALLGAAIAFLKLGRQSG